jgi:DNA-binding NarL/FixJ family response regulator
VCDDRSASEGRITVFLLDDHEIFRRGLRDLLEAAGDIEVVGEAATQDEAVGRVHAFDPDVAVLDVRLEEGNGIEACREIRSRHPRTACLILTSFADDEALFQAIMAGRRGMSSSRSAPWTSSRRCGGSGPVRTCSILG